MPKRDLHSILGVPAGADIETIKTAYRRLALQVHPDTGTEPDPARFREVHEAYAELSDAARRRSHDIDIGRVTRASRPLEEIKASGPVSIIDDFESLAPSLGEILDHLAQNFFGFHHKSGGPLRRLDLEIMLSREEAQAGGRLPVEVPCYEPCASCGGGAWMWGICPRCHGYGMVETTRQVMLDIPPAIRSGSRYQLLLESIGISNLMLVVTVLVA
jgi:molecular chaperone DnaJ